MTLKSCRPKTFSGFNTKGNDVANRICLLELFDARNKSLGVFKFYCVPKIFAPLIVGIEVLQTKFGNQFSRSPAIQFGNSYIRFLLESKCLYEFRRVTTRINVINTFFTPGWNSVSIRNDSKLPITIDTGDQKLILPVGDGKYEKIRVYSDNVTTTNDWLNTAKIANVISQKVTKKSKHNPHYRKTICSPNDLDLSKIRCGKTIQKSQQLQLKELLMKHHHVFSRAENDYGCYNGSLTYEILIQNEIRDSYKTRPFNRDDRLFLAEEVKKLEANGIVEKTNCTRIMTGFVVVTKRDNRKRLCLDSRIVNKETLITHNYPLPDLNSILTEIAGHKYYTCLDCNSAYWQIKVPREQRDLYTFLCEGQVYRFKRSSFGTKGMSSFYCSVMAEVLTGIENVWFYLDDIICASDTVEQMLKTLDQCLDRFSKFNMTLSINKSCFMMEKIDVFGYEMSRTGFVPIGVKINKILELPLPKTKKALQSSLGAMNYYRNSAPNFKHFAARFYDKISTYSYDPQNDTEDWKALLNTFKNPCVRCKPCYEKPVFLKTDASEKSGGWIISQLGPDNKESIILADGCVFRGLTLTSKISHKELYCIYIALKKHHKLIMLFPQVDIVCDNVAVVKALQKIDLITIEKVTSPVRWITFIVSFNFTIRHAKGTVREFALVDQLSRIDGADPFPVTFGQLRSEELLVRGSAQTCAAVRLEDVFRSFDYAKIRKMVTDWQQKSKNFLLNIDLKKNIIVKNLGSKKVVYDTKGRLIVPNDKIKDLLDLLHDHTSVKALLNLLSNLGLTFPNKYRIVDQSYKACLECAIKHANYSKESKAYSFDWVTQVGDCFALDVVHINTGNETFYFLGAVDHYSGYSQFERLPDLKMDTVVTGTIKIFCRLIVPSSIVVDNAKYYGSTFTDLMESLNVRISFTTPRNSQGNSRVERKFRTLQDKLKVLLQCENLDVDTAVQLAGFLCNHIEKADGYTPIELVLARKDNFPLNIPDFSNTKFLKMDSRIKAWYDQARKMLIDIEQRRLKKELGKRPVKVKKGDVVIIKAYNDSSNPSKPSITPFFSKERFKVLEYKPYTGSATVERIDNNTNRRRKILKVHARNLKILPKININDQIFDSDVSDSDESCVSGTENEVHTGQESQSKEGRKPSETVKKVDVPTQENSELEKENLLDDQESPKDIRQNHSETNPSIGSRLRKRKPISYKE